MAGNSQSWKPLFLFCVGTQMSRRRKIFTRELISIDSSTSENQAALMRRRALAN